MELLKMWSTSALVVAGGVILSIMGLFGLFIHSVFFLIGGPNGSEKITIPIAALLIAINVATFVYVWHTRSDWIENRRLAQGLITKSSIREFETETTSSDAHGNRHTTTQTEQVRFLEWVFKPGVNAAEVNGKTFLDPNNKPSELKMAAEAGPGLSEGAPISVYYDARDPKRNFITEYPTEGQFRTLVGAVIFALLYGAYIYGMLQYLQYIKNLPPASQ